MQNLRSLSELMLIGPRFQHFKVRFLLKRNQTLQCVTLCWVDVMDESGVALVEAFG